MNTIFITAAEVYEKDLEITVRYMNQDGPCYIPIAKKGIGLSLRQMKHNTKINHLTGELIPSEEDEEKAELLVFFYQLEEERQNIEEGLGR